MKIPQLGSLGSKKSAQRFLREARAAGNLRHPNIVPIYEAGQVGGSYFIASGYIEGRTLEARLHEDQPLPRHEAVVLIKKLAGALHYAHGKGIVHRDVKPANVMIDTDGEPLLLDFGTARREESDVLVTQEGARIGTPAYMSPEQHAGQSHQADGRSDQWALGVVLYEMLTGQRPFQADIDIQVGYLVRETEPNRPQKIDATIDRDLETICLKCLEKEPDQRYATCQDLADELDRFLRGEPIRARPIGRMERAWRWSRRNPVVAGLIAVVLFALSAGTGVSSYFAVKATRSAREALTEKSRAVDDWKRAEREKDHAEKNAQLAQSTLVKMATTLGVSADEQGKPEVAALWFAHASNLTSRHDDPDPSHALRWRLWTHSLYQPVRALPHPNWMILRVLPHPGEKHMLVMAQNYDCRLWNLPAEQPRPLPGGERLVSAAAWNPAGTLLFLAEPSGAATLCRFPSGERVAGWENGDAVTAVAFSPDGERLATGDRERVVVRDITGDRALTTITHGGAGGVRTVGFDSTGRYLATSTGNNTARVFDLGANVAKPPELFAPVRHVHVPGWYRSNPPQPPAFVSGGWLTWDSKTLTCRGLPTGEIRWTVTPPGTRWECLDVSHNGQFVGLGGLEDWLIYETDRGALLFQGRHRNAVTQIAFDTVEPKFYVASADRTLTVHLLGDPMPGHFESLAQPVSVLHVGLMPTARYFWTAQRDGIVQIWRPPTGALRERRACPDHDIAIEDVACSPDAEAFVIVRRVLELQVFSASTGQPARPAVAISGRLRCAAFSPAGRWLLLGRDDSSDGGAVECWDWEQGQPVWAPQLLRKPPAGVEWSPDTKQFAVLTSAGEVYFGDPATGRLVSRGVGQRGGRISHRTFVRFSPNGKWLVTNTPYDPLRLWSVDGRSLGRQLEHSGLTFDATFSPDSRFLFTGGFDNRAVLWDVASGGPAEEVRLPDWVLSGRFSSDGRQLVVAGRDGSALVFDRPLGPGRKPRLVLPHRDEVFEAVFLGQDRWIATAARDSTIRVWDARTGRPVSPRVTVAGGVSEALAFVVAGRRIFAANRSRGQLLCCDLQDLIEPPGVPAGEVMLLHAELNSDKAVADNGGGVANLSSEEWLARWRRLDKLGQRPAYP